MMRALLFLIGVLFSCHALATIDTYTFKDEAQEQQFRQLTEQLRCPKCQNNSIADSSAMIASDMKLKVYELMQQGKSKQQIIDYMVERYGHFVTYTPPVTPATAALWVLPILFVIGGIGVIVLRSRRRQKISLLDDDTPINRQATRNISWWVFLPGVLILVVVSVGSYLKTSGLRQVFEWQQTTAMAPELLKRVLDPQARPLTMEDMARLELGLRTRLQQQPDNIEGWVMLGRLGIVLNNATAATQAFARAWQLAPANNEVKLDYAEVLTRSEDTLDNRLGSVLLHEVLKDDHANTRALGLLGANAFGRQRYREAIGIWEKMLKILPANDQRRTVIESSIDRAKALSGMGSTESANKQ